MRLSHFRRWIHWRCCITLALTPQWPFTFLPRNTSRHILAHIHTHAHTLWVCYTISSAISGCARLYQHCAHRRACSGTRTTSGFVFMHVMSDNDRHVLARLQSISHATKCDLWSQCKRLNSAINQGRSPGLRVRYGICDRSIEVGGAAKLDPKWLLNLNTGKWFCS